MLNIQKLGRHLLLQNGENFGEIAPLPGFSKESLEEAEKETLSLLPHLHRAKLPSVRWGYLCSQKKLFPLNIPIASLGIKPGFSFAKLKLGHLSLQEALTLTQSHYKTHRLRLDFNRKWPLQKTVEFVSHFHPDDFDYLEEPTQTFSELITFSDKTNFPIALDESIHNTWSQIKSLKAIVVKPMILGYIPKVKPPLQLILSSSHETSLGILHIAQKAQELNLKEPMGLDTPIEITIFPFQKQNGRLTFDPLLKI